MRRATFALNQTMSAYHAEHTVLPAMLKLVGISGRLFALEGGRKKASDEARHVLDTLGGADYWVETKTTLVMIASRVQRHHDEAYRSFTWRTEVGWGPTEAHKRIEAFQTESFMPKWTVQGYVTEAGALHHGGIIQTWELCKAYLDAKASGRPMASRRNPDDGHKFWPAFWDTLRKYGNATTLHVIEPPAAASPPRPMRAPRPTASREIDMTNPDCWHPTLHRPKWVANPVTERLVCQVCHPTPGTPEFEKQRGRP